MRNYKNKPLYDFRDKAFNVRRICEHTLNRTIQMFKYDGLPETIPARYIELYAQRDRTCIIADVRGELYALQGAPGGKCDAYYRPTSYVVANPWLNISKEYTIGADCCILYNDSLVVGLLPIITRYATALVENELTLFISDINARINTIISAGDEITKTNAEQFLKDIEGGKQGVITDNAFIEALKTSPYGNAASAGQITQLIEYEQYLKGAMWAELGLRENYNMKRESIGAGEAGLLNDILLPLVDDMLMERQIFVDNVNKMFGTNITVSLGSAWEDNEIETERALEEPGESGAENE